MIAFLSNSSYLLIRGCVRTTLWNNRQLGPVPESGGVLLGSYRGPHIEVTNASTPGESDIRKTDEFTRQDYCHQQLADLLWLRSEGEITYVGEWHTHPTSDASPSVCDYKEWYSRLPKATMVLLIQGTRSLRLDVLEIVGGEKRIRQLQFVEV